VQTSAVIRGYCSELIDSMERNETITFDRYAMMLILTPQVSYVKTLFFHPGTYYAAITNTRTF
jgi:hypothetical protein